MSRFALVYLEHLAGIILFKLKRNLKYKNCENFQYVRPNKIIMALKWLQNNNINYQKVKENPKWLQECVDEDEETLAELTEVNEHETSQENNDLSLQCNHSKTHQIPLQPGDRLNGDNS